MQKAKTTSSNRLHPLFIGVKCIFIIKKWVNSSVVEPICNETTNVVENGVERKLTVNPCGVVIGKNAYFRIQVLPEDYPDDQIVWEAKGAGEVEFVNGNKGRQVTVRGLKKGKVEMTIQIGDAKSIKPSFEIYVVEEKSVDLRVWMISDKNNDLSKPLSEVYEMVKGANDIYAQVGVYLNLIEPIVITNIPGAFTPLMEEGLVGFLKLNLRQEIRLVL